MYTKKIDTNCFVAVFTWCQSASKCLRAKWWWFYRILYFKLLLVLFSFFFIKNWLRLSREEKQNSMTKVLTNYFNKFSISNSKSQCKFFYLRNLCIHNYTYTLRNEIQYSKKFESFKINSCQYFCSNSLWISLTFTDVFCVSGATERILIKSDRI